MSGLELAQDSWPSKPAYNQHASKHTLFFCNRGNVNKLDGMNLDPKSYLLTALFHHRNLFSFIQIMWDVTGVHPGCIYPLTLSADGHPAVQTGMEQRESSVLGKYCSYQIRLYCRGAHAADVIEFDSCGESSYFFTHASILRVLLFSEHIRKSVLRTTDELIHFSLLSTCCLLNCLPKNWYFPPNIVLQHYCIFYWTERKFESGNSLQYAIYFH